MQSIFTQKILMLELAVKNATESTDMNRNQIESERKRYLPHVSDDLESGGTKVCHYNFESRISAYELY